MRASTGEHLDLEAMSDGTRDQLFLALRLAYIETCCDNGTPCPVILDDVLIADERTAAALRALRDVSKKTQVLVFTHHAQHVAITESVLTPEDYRVHQLSRVFGISCLGGLNYCCKESGGLGLSPSVLGAGTALAARCRWQVATLMRTF